jgi:hypothetical protein
MIHCFWNDDFNIELTYNDEMQKINFCFNLKSIGPGAMVGGSGGNPVTSGLTLPGSGTTVFPLPGSFPWSAGARG